MMNIYFLMYTCSDDLTISSCDLDSHVKASYYGGKYIHYNYNIKL